MGTLIRGGTIVTATDVNRADILVEGETVSQLAKRVTESGHDVVDASGCYVFPGGIDPHTHLDMPFGGTVTADDFESGTIAAALGGTTTIIDFALHQRGDSLHNALKKWHAKAKGKAVIDYAFHLTIADGRDETMNEIRELIEQEGVNSFKVFMAYKGVLQVDDETIFKTLKAAAAYGGLVQLHAENGDVIDVMIAEARRKGHKEPKYHALTRPVEAEGEATSRGDSLGRDGRCAALRRARVKRHGGRCNQRRTQARSADLRRDVSRSILCAIPRTTSGRTLPVPTTSCRPRCATNGIRAFCCASSRIWSCRRLVPTNARSTTKAKRSLGKTTSPRFPMARQPSKTDWPSCIKSASTPASWASTRSSLSTSTNPAKLFGLFPRKGTIAVGSDADILVWDPKSERTISAQSHHMNADNNIFEGIKVKGRPRFVFSRGRKIVDDGKFTGSPGIGAFQKCDKFFPVQL